MTKKIGVLVFSLTVMLVSCGKSGQGTSSSAPGKPKETAGEYSGKEKYVLAVSGLNLREEPSLEAKVVINVPLGAKVKLMKSDKTPATLVVDGLSGLWEKAEYQGKQGYLFGGYLSVYPAPMDCTSLSEYVEKHYKEIAKPVTNRQGDSREDEEGYSQEVLRKFEGGVTIRQKDFYERGLIIYQFPGMSIEEAFLLSRLCKGYPTAKMKFPTKNGKVVTDPESGYEMDIKVQTADGEVLAIEIVSDYEWYVFRRNQADVTEIEVGGGS